MAWRVISNSFAFLRSGCILLWMGWFSLISEFWRCLGVNDSLEVKFVPDPLEGVLLGETQGFFKGNFILLSFFGSVYHYSILLGIFAGSF